VAEDVSTYEFTQSEVDLSIHWNELHESTVLFEIKFFNQVNS
jgi:hypothetical protein